MMIKSLEIRLRFALNTAIAAMMFIQVVDALIECSIHAQQKRINDCVILDFFRRVSSDHRNVVCYFISAFRFVIYALSRVSELKCIFFSREFMVYSCVTDDLLQKS